MEEWKSGKGLYIYIYIYLGGLRGLGREEWVMYDVI